MTIHVYNRSESGKIRHDTQYGEDLGGVLSVTGEVIALAGWPTPAMRQAVAGNGDTLAWFIGTDAIGSIQPAIHTIRRKTARRLKERQA